MLKIIASCIIHDIIITISFKDLKSIRKVNHGCYSSLPTSKRLIPLPSVFTSRTVFSLKTIFLPTSSISCETISSLLQLEHARLTQTELMRESFRHNQEINELLQKQEELQERLTEEARAREQLALELHRAEGEFL